MLVFQSNTIHWKRTTSCDYKAVLKNFCWILVLNFTHFLSQNLIYFFQVIGEKEHLKMKAYKRN